MRLGPRRVFAWLLLAVLAAGCGRDEPARAEAGPEPFRVGAENIVRADRGTIVVGPTISGELSAERAATVRAEVAGELLDVSVEEGEEVRRGQVLARIDARALREAESSARTAVQSAESAVRVARREAERTALLVSAGALAQRDLDNAESAVAAAEARLADARAGLSTAEESLGDTVVRAPFAGVVASRAVNTGDVTSAGGELLTIIDPSSMRLEASVPSSAIASLRVGMPVRFDVRGYDETFEGRIERISPRADEITRQVPIFVSIPNTGGRLVAGLFAEGRVVVDSATGLVVPDDVVNREGDGAWVLRVDDGEAVRVPVDIGLVDERTEVLEIRGEVAPGDLLLRGAARNLTPGSPVAVEPAADDGSR